MSQPEEAAAARLLGRAPPIFLHSTIAERPIDAVETRRLSTAHNETVAALAATAVADVPT